MAKRIIIGVHISSRMKSVPQVQKILSEYGCSVKTRLGLHNVSEISARQVVCWSLRCSETKPPSQRWRSS